ncbi:MAG: cellulase family glycosylhydrolase [Chloroflexi bacterium]|nr:cellulase family glycosylhydrolase [Chloroflexota bacterium]
MIKQPVVWFSAGLVSLIVMVVAFRQPLSDAAFGITGEEETVGQVRGLVQWVFGSLRPPLDLDPYAEIDHASVNPFGINTFLHHEVEVAKREEQVRLIAEAGFHWIRQEFPWEDIEIHGRGDFIDRRNDPDGVDAWIKYDNIVDLAEQYDLEIIARVDNPPAWSRAVGNEMGAFAPPDDFADFARYAAVLAEHYRGRITYYQIWNEPNIYPEWGEYDVNPVDYTDLLCQTYRAIKEVNPDAVIITGALAPTSELSGRDFNDFLFLERMYDAGVGDCFDILAMQGYGLWSGPYDRRMRPLVVNYSRNLYIRDVMVRHGDAHKAIWISEMNWNVAPEDVEPRFGRVSTDQQARWATLAYERAEAEWPWMGVVNFWYFKRADDVWLSERRPEAFFQMAEPDFTLQPVYHSMQDYTAQPGVMGLGSHAADHWVVERQEIGDTQQTNLRFEGSALSIRLAEADGCQVTLRVDGQTIPQIDPCPPEVTWSGLQAEHQVELTVEGNARIERYVVRRGQAWPYLLPPVLTLIGLVSVGLLRTSRRANSA